MKLMPVLLLTIFILVTSGKPNALETTIEEDRDDSMAPHEGLGAVIGNGGELSSGFDEFEVPRPSSDVISSRMFGFTFPILKPKNCECMDHMYGDYGNCKKDGLCYIDALACCKDKKMDRDADYYYSKIACNPSSRKKTQIRQFKLLC